MKPKMSIKIQKLEQLEGLPLYQVRLFKTDNYGTYECGVLDPCHNTKEEAHKHAKQLRKDYC